MFSPGGGFIITGGDDGDGANMGDLDRANHSFPGGPSGPDQRPRDQQRRNDPDNRQRRRDRQDLDTRPVDERDPLLDQTDEVCSVAYSPTNSAPPRRRRGQRHGHTLRNTRTRSRLARAVEHG